VARNYRIEVLGADRTERSLERDSLMVRRSLVEATREADDEILDSMVALGGTEKLRGNIDFVIEVDPGGRLLAGRARGGGLLVQTLVVSRVIVRDLGVWIEQGTGIYGPHHQRIRPRRGKRALSFIWGNAPSSLKRPTSTGAYAGKYAFDSVRGTPPHPYLDEAVRVSEAEVERIYDEHVDRALKGFVV